MCCFNTSPRSHALRSSLIPAVLYLALGGKQATIQTFQVLRLPWMAEVLEPPGAAPVKTWKV